MKKYLIILVAILLIFFYLIFFPQSTAREFVMSPGAVINHSTPEFLNNIQSMEKGVGGVYLSPISVQKVQNSRRIIGLLNGKVMIMDNTGKVLFDFMPSGSRIKAIFGAAISESESRFALISGLDPQRFLMLQEDVNGFRLDFQYRLDSDFRQPVFMKFVSDDRFVIYNGMYGVEAVNVISGKSMSLGIEDMIDVWDIDTDMIVMIVRNRNNSELLVLPELPYGGVPLMEIDIPVAFQTMQIINEKINLEDDSRTIILETTIQ